MSEWLETTQGANWLHCAADDLCAGRELIINGSPRVSMGDFDAAVQAQAMPNVESNENWLGQLIIAAADYQTGSAKGAAVILMGNKSVYDVAVELCTPHADEALAEIIEQNRPEAA